MDTTPEETAPSFVVEDSGESKPIITESEEATDTGPTSREELPMIGELGANALLKALTSTSNPLQAIIQFRRENGLHTPRISTDGFLPGIELNDLKGGRRRELYKSVFEHMMKLLLERCEQLSADQRQALLTETFPYIRFKELQELPFTLLRLTPDIPDAYLNQLSCNAELYGELPLPVKRQIWRAHPHLFLARVQPILDSFYHSQLTNQVLSLSDLLTPKQRRERYSQLKELEDLIGDSLLLYKLVVQYCFILYQGTGCPHYCTLRSELILYLRDTNHLEIFRADPSSKLALLVDSLHTPDKLVGDQQLKEVVELLQDIPEGHEFLAEQAFILAKPPTIDLLSQAIFQGLQDVVENMEEISDFSQHQAIAGMTRCVAWGLSAFQMITSGTYQCMPLGKEIFVEFYGQLIHRLVDDQLREPQDAPPEVTEDVVRLFFTHPTARKVMLQYILHRIRAEDVDSVQQLLKLVAGLESRVNAESSFLQTLLSLPVVLEEKMRRIILDEFLLPLSGQIEVHVTLLEFLRTAHSRLTSEQLLVYLQGLSTFRPHDEHEVQYVLHYARNFRQRVGARIDTDNAPFFFEYFHILEDPRAHLQSLRNEAASTSSSSLDELNAAAAQALEAEEANGNSNSPSMEDMDDSAPTNGDTEMADAHDSRKASPPTRALDTQGDVAMSSEEPA